MSVVLALTREIASYQPRPEPARQVTLARRLHADLTAVLHHAETLVDLLGNTESIE